ncbi:Protein M3 [Microbotryomycetes sp. JL201]|nr:Protein M3 [Microbotryomycetes sp. JL201]
MSDFLPASAATAKSRKAALKHSNKPSQKAKGKQKASSTLLPTQPQQVANGAGQFGDENDDADMGFERLPLDTRSEEQKRLAKERKGQAVTAEQAQAAMDMDDDTAAGNEEDDDAVMIDPSSLAMPTPAPSSTVPPALASSNPLSFPAVSHASNTNLTQRRKITIPPHRMTPLKRDWIKIYTPLVEECGLQVRMNVHKRQIEMKTSKHTPGPSSLTRAADFLAAFNLGFAVEDAIAMLRLEELYIESFEIKDIKMLHGDHLSRAIGRLAGHQGKTRHVIENASRTRIVLADTKIHILGSFANIKIARDSISALVLGSSTFEQPTINQLIWMSVKPLIKLFIPCSMGFWMSRSGLLPPAGSRAASQIILNVTLPSLLFAKILPSFTPDNVKAIGPIVLVDIFYMVLSGLFALLIRLCLPVPRNFRWGLFAASMWSNQGDLPINVVATICSAAPFQGQRDADLAVAYVSIFILVFYVTMFPLKGTLFISRDYTHSPRKIPADQEASAMDKTPFNKLAKAARTGLRQRRRQTNVDAENAVEEDNAAATVGTEQNLSNQMVVLPTGFTPLRRTSTSRSSQPSIRELAGTAAAASVEEGNRGRRPSLSKRHEQFRQALRAQDQLRTIVGSPAHSVFDDTGEETVTAVETNDSRNQPGSKLAQSRLDPVSQEDGDEKIEVDNTQGGSVLSEAAREEPMWKRLLRGVRDFVSSLATPPTLSLLTALVCALVSKLKALFVFVPDQAFNPVAPDGKPPLAILLETASFVGAASVPLGLMVLGSALERMRLPRPLSNLPFSSITALALAKLVLLPIIGYLFVQALTMHTSLVAEDNKVLRFVLIYFSCLPTATTQVALTQIFAPEDGESNSDTLASYIVLQYIIFVFSSVVLTAITLSNIF